MAAIPQTAAAPHRSRAWRVLVPVVCLVAGLGFAVSARDAGGTDLRASSTPGLVGTVRAAEARVATADAQARALQAQLDARTRAAASGRLPAKARAALAATQLAAGRQALRGAGLLVVLDDAPQATDATGSGTGTTVTGTDGTDPNQLLIHQSDVQSIVNALWEGGAQAMSIEGQRMIATSAVRCVGNTLLLNGNVYSPPYRIVALGPATGMQNTLSASPGVRFFQEAADYYGLGYTVAPAARLRVPAYRGATTLTYARAGA